MSAHSSTAPKHDTKVISRREFLYYLGGASIALLGGGAGAVLYRFVQPHTDFSSQVLEFDPARLRAGEPVFFREAQVYLTMPDQQLLALSHLCSFRQTRVLWVAGNHRFECPKCGSKYRLDGQLIEGPASRGLDRYKLRVETPQGLITTPEDGSSIPYNDPVRLWVDTRYRIPGPPVLQ